jgi:hypothetical protein
MSYTLAAAAAACGRNKTTVLRAIKSGKVSGTRDENGLWHVEPIDLHRLYPAVAEHGASSDAPPRYASAEAAALAAAQRRAVLAEEKLCMLIPTFVDADSLLARHFRSRLAVIRCVASSIDSLRAANGRGDTIARRLQLGRFTASGKTCR